ncbi:MAG: TolC family protein [Verrucomicrobia bacterium]|nr:TolC family protein [Verrucomicrobiota bacterium]
MASLHRCVATLAGVTLTFALAGCSSVHYRKSADKEVYQILKEKQTSTLGKTNAINIDTPYSPRDPQKIQSDEILQDRLGSGRRKLTLDDALKIAIESSRNYQFRKESLYLTALTLTHDRYDYRPKFFGSVSATRARTSAGDQTGEVQSTVGVTQALKSGASLGLSIANDLLRYYTGDPRRSAVSTISANLAQPLLRGAGVEIAAENLKQSERNVIYEIRSFSRFQDTFALDIISTYYRLLQQKDTVRNEYNNYTNLVAAVARVKDLSVDRLAAFQVDQANQDELSAKNRYILAVQNFQTQLDQFKTTLSLPLGVELALDDAALTDLTSAGLMPVNSTEAESFETAVKHRLDLLNEIDRFEDARRKIKVAANQLKPRLNLVANASLPSRGPTDYAHFNLNDYQASAGLELNLPFDRLSERNNYRASLINFERELRTLALTLDGVRSDVRQGLRLLGQARQSYQIQRNASELATKRVDSANTLLQAGRAQVRDLLEAQTAQVLARNAVTQSLVDYHVARLRLLIDLGILDTGAERFWLKPPPGTPKAEVPSAAEPAAPMPEEVIPPDELFGK